MRQTTRREALQKRESGQPLHAGRGLEVEQWWPADNPLEPEAMRYKGDPPNRRSATVKDPDVIGRTSNPSITRKPEEPNPPEMRIQEMLMASSRRPLRYRTQDMRIHELGRTRAARAHHDLDIQGQPASEGPRRHRTQVGNMHSTHHLLLQ